MIQRSRLVLHTLASILIFSGCTLQANFESGDPASTHMPLSVSYYSEAYQSSVSDATAAPTLVGPTAILPTRVSASPEAKATQRGTRPTATPTPRSTTVRGQSGGSRTQAAPSPTSVSATPTQCQLEYSTAVVTHDQPVQAYPGVEYADDVIAVLHPGDVIIVTGWWNDGTNPWWWVAFEGGSGWVPGFSVETQAFEDPCTVLYSPYIFDPFAATPMPTSTQPSVMLGAPFQVGPMQWVSIDAGNLWVRVTYIHDTRCIPDTECTDPGSVLIDLEITSQGTTTTRQLVQTEGTYPSTTVDGYTITLLALDTYRDPPDGPPTGYTITLRVD